MPRRPATHVEGSFGELTNKRARRRFFTASSAIRQTTHADAKRTADSCAIPQRSAECVAPGLRGLLRSFPCRISTARMRPSRVGTVTLLFTDIEGSTRLWEEDGERMSRALARARCARPTRGRGPSRHGGEDDRRRHARASSPMRSTRSARRSTCSRRSPIPRRPAALRLRVRCGLHAGVVERRDNDYFGSPSTAQRGS